MAVYVTKSLLTKMSKVKFKNSVEEDYLINMDHSDVNDPWVALFSKPNVELSKEMICRVCARNGCTPITEKLNGFDITSAIHSVTNLSINTEDSLPKYICTDCLNTLQIALDFKKRCESSERKFKKILYPMGDPAFHSYPYSRHDFNSILNQMKQKQSKQEEKWLKKCQEKEKLLEKKVPKDKLIKCSCDMTFPDKKALSEHRRSRQCMRRACDICGQLVISISQHMRQFHRDSEKPGHECPTCGKEFPIIARLKNHMLVHTNTFSYFCDLCPYKCKHKYYLVMHMRTHTGEKPYKCRDCCATFVNPSNLNKHKLTHMEKQFKCAVCEKAFRTSIGLREHHDAAHLNIRHSCQFCGRNFCYKSDLRKHEIRSHNRTKREYLGGEPSYKQAERLQKAEDGMEAEAEACAEAEAWRAPEPVALVACAPYLDPKDYAQQPIYFSDVQGILQHQTQIVQPQTVQMSLPDLNMKKDDVKMYEEIHHYIV